jgi:hypothetical protein
MKTKREHFFLSCNLSQTSITQRQSGHRAQTRDVFRQLPNHLSLRHLRATNKKKKVKQETNNRVSNLVDHDAVLVLHKQMMHASTHVSKSVLETKKKKGEQNKNRSKQEGT